MQIELTKLGSCKFEISSNVYALYYFVNVLICLLELVLRTLVNLFPHYCCDMLSVNNVVTLPHAMPRPREKFSYSLTKIISLPFGVIE